MTRTRSGRVRLVVALALIGAAGLAAFAAAPAAATGLQTSDPAWTWQLPTPQGNALLDLAFIDEDVGWAVGRYGTILHTADGGVSWTSQTSGTRADLTAVVFVGVLDGWVVGTNGTVLRTRDGGASWQACGPATYHDFEDVWFTTALDGWVVGWDGAYRTSDGGVSWQVADFPWKNDPSPGAVWFSGSGTGVLGCGRVGPLVRTTDGGATWSRPKIAGLDWWDHVDDLSFVSDTEGWAVGSVVLHTTDAGATWTKTKSPAWWIDDAEFTDATHGWILAGGDLFASTDGGVTWSVRRSFAWASPVALAFGSPSRAWLAGEAGCVRTSGDGGGSWQVQTSGAVGLRNVPELTAVAFADDAATGCAVGRDGTIVQTADGGATWTARVSGTPHSLLAAAFSQDGPCYAVGERGICLRSEDGGITWERLSVLPRSSQVRFVAVAAPGPGYVIALGEGPSWPYSTVVARSDDSGATWTTATIARGWGPSDMTWPDVQHGWIALNGDLWQTTDGGATWRTQQRLAGPDDGFDRIRFTDPVNGWAVCAGGDSYLMHTTDGGATWTKSRPDHRAEFSCYFTDLEFSDAMHGWILAPGYDPEQGPAVSCGLLHTVDGGQTWSAVAMGASGWINDVAAVGSDQVWAVGTAEPADVDVSGGGSDGIILHSGTGGGAPPVTTCDLASRWWHYSSNESLTVTLDVHDTGTGVAGTWYRVDRAPRGSAWRATPSPWVPAGDGTTIDFPAPADHSGDGFYILHFFSRDLLGMAELEHEREIVIDTLGPALAALTPRPIRSGEAVKLRCVVRDATSMYVRVRMRLIGPTGRVVARRAEPVFMDYSKETASLRITTRLAPGRYRFEARATDEAGNTQLAVGTSVLIVR